MATDVDIDRDHAQPLGFSAIEYIHLMSAISEEKKTYKSFKWMSGTVPSTMDASILIIDL